MSDRDYYCSLKFKFIKIDLQSTTTCTCHYAKPHAVDFSWLESNPGQLFNNPINVYERHQMLNNQRNVSCEQNCWPAEDQGAMSPRQSRNGQEKTHIKIHTQPEIIEISTVGDCNLTCSYCCKEYSSAWRRDVVNNGDYPILNIKDRYQASDKDRVLLKISQQQLQSSNRYQKLLNEIKLAGPTVKKLVVTGGEPLLDNQLITVLEDLKLSSNAILEIWTGLGFSTTRFNSVLTKLENLPNLQLIVSAENTKKFAEFNRYGINWTEFVDKIELLKTKKINLKLHATVSNLAMFDFANFYTMFKDLEIEMSLPYQPTFMSPYVLDPESKERIQQSIAVLPAGMQETLLKSMSPIPTELQKQNLHAFLKEFVRRRSDLHLDIFPQSFLTWLEL
jgi:organic radical activating enzyme